MLRINLLPAYIAERQKVRNAIIGSVFAFLLVVGGLLAWQFGSLQPTLDKTLADATDKEAQATAEQAIESKTSSIRAGIKPLQEKVDFVKNVRFYNTLRPALFRNAATYSYKEVEYNQMSVNGNTLSTNGYVKSIADIGRFYITFYGNPDVTAVSVAGIPAWQQNAQNPTLPGQAIPERLRSFPVALTATLAKSVTAPTLPASLQQGAAGGAPVGVAGGPPPGAGAPPPDSAPSAAQ